jgi:hypothetical protein
MCRSHVIMIVALVGLAGTPWCGAVLVAGPQDAGRLEDTGQVEVLVRGPVHEAFAEPVDFDPEPSPAIATPPPEPIDEQPPDQQPEGAGVEWIPGYWAWDADRDGYIWVSGVWRDLPPGREWVPGYWLRTEAGSQWVPGYWTAAKTTKVVYLPEPPQTVEAGPTVAAPSPDYVWVSGVWLWSSPLWRSHRYVWRPGYWMPGRADWVWVPAHYVWTPRGYVFTDGYWDYPAVRRGVLFAPVRFRTLTHVVYSPTTTVNLDVFEDHLFVRTSDYHYYFGDYYAARPDINIHPVFSFHLHGGYDPIYAHARWVHRSEPSWEHDYAAHYQQRREHEDARPPRTLAQVAVHGGGRERPIVTPLAQWAKSASTPVRLRSVGADERQRLAQRGADVQRFRRERRDIEMGAVASREKAGSQKEVKAKFPRSPIVAKLTKGKERVPPKAPATPKPDSKITPRPRRK